MSSTALPTSLRKINAFALDPAQKCAFAGNQMGEIVCVDVDTFDIRARRRVLSSEINAVAVHPSLPYVAAFAADMTLALCRYDRDGRVDPLQIVPIPRIRLENTGGYAQPSWWTLVHTLDFHPTDPRLLTRSGDGALCEIQFSEAGWDLLWCKGYFPGMKGGPPREIYSTRYLVDERFIFCSALGELVVIDRENLDEPVFRFRHPGATSFPFHWAEHVEGDDYLVTCDIRRIYRVDMTGRKAPRASGEITRDHMEIVDYNKTSRRALLTSFDRCVHEVDPTTLEDKGVVIETPFKLRWLKTLERDPSTLILQCRNGSLYKLSLKDKALVGTVRETPSAFWSGVALDSKRVCIAGESAHVLSITATGEDAVRLDTKFSTAWEELPGNSHRFTKRMIVHRTTGALVAARSDGDIVVAAGNRKHVLVNVGSAVRDICAPVAGFDVFACCEDGRAHRVSLETGKILATYASPEDRPFWSCAYNDEARVLAIGEQHGSLRLMDPDSMQCTAKIPGTMLVKRMRWLDADRLLFSQGCELVLLTLSSRKTEVVVSDVDNTIEDFDWDEGRRFLAFCTYQNRVELHDYETFDSLDISYADIDYPHGLLWLSRDRAPNAFPYELIVFGRSGEARRYRVHNNMLVAMGPLNDPAQPPSDPARGFVFR